VEETQADAEDAGADGDAGGNARPESIAIPNPDYITDTVFTRLKKWVHNWIPSRIPERHRHLVQSDVAKGDLDDLFVKVYGLAARDPKLYCSAIKTRMMGLPLEFETFDATARASMGPGPIRIVRYGTGCKLPRGIQDTGERIHHPRHPFTRGVHAEICGALPLGRDAGQIMVE
jgi:hypothetical protein